ncbi:RRM1_TatSF1_like and RRM2_TatSF1_like domain-containing protein barc [Brevipalpus obovatus]|uniref:RRM1_TatSF1_like and RRM2_TatSF1_like domain-containing protein barc n=1 Tax=Brevipalpus obovatus TaxID=246614 RepID=UPI003D9EC0BB
MSELTSEIGDEAGSTVEEKNDKKRKRDEPKPGWFEIDDDHNTSVYVSNLPLDTTEDDFIVLMKKCGLIMKDIDTGNFKIKLYNDKQGNFKGDALCTYIKVESVELALQILDEYLVGDKVIRVERAKFQLKGEYDPSKRPKKRKAKDKRKIKEKTERLFDWRPDKLPGERSNCEKTVVIMNMFDPSEFDEDPALILEYKKDVRDECVEKFGEVKRVEIYDRNPEGVVTVQFKEFDMADKCVEIMNGRWFAQRKLKAFNWDGRTKYKIQETEEEAAKRIEKWDKFLESEGVEDSTAGNSSTSVTANSHADQD